MILVSACLLGHKVKYNGGSNDDTLLQAYNAQGRFVAVCPECFAMLPVPRAPGEIQDGIVRNEDGTSVDYEYRTGAAKALEIAESERIDMAILQSRSPSCGVNQIYDGSFTGRKIKGMGVFARLLSEKGYKVVDAEDI